MTLSFLAPITTLYGDLFYYKEIIGRMERKFDGLDAKRSGVQLLVDEAINNGEIVRPDVEVWMKRVYENEARVYKILEDKERFEKRCLNVKSRYGLSRKARKITRNVEELLMEESFERIAYPPPPYSKERLPPIEVEALDDDEDQEDEIVDAASAQLQPCRRFTLAEIQSATDNFKDAFVIGKGGFGKVYKGFVDHGATVVAIKRLDPTSNQGGNEFRTEIKMLYTFRHCNLMSLIGYCKHGCEMILIYEYMVNGSLADHLYPKDGGRYINSSILSWVQRLKICIGAARGIDYLHTGTGDLQRVIHRDVKSSNILLNENWAAKVSDFGLCKIGPANQSCTHVSTCVKGTLGYCDPNYFLTRRLTRKSDVYSLGVVLLEVLSGKPVLGSSLPKGQRSLVAWAQKCIEENTIHQLIDPNLKWEIYPNSLTKFVEIANQCLQNDSKKRPKMAEVVASLELALESQTSQDSSLLAEDIFDNQEMVGSCTIGSPVTNSGAFKPESIVLDDRVDTLDASENIPKDEQSLQNEGGDTVDKEWLKIDDNEGGKKVEAETNDNDDDGTPRATMYKNLLQELAQRSCFNLPSYAYIREGPDHAPRFKASVDFCGEIFESPNYCTTLRQAEHSAAEVALNILSSRCPSKSLTARVLDETGVSKNLLQETAHREGLKLPVYKTVGSGPGHVPVFTCTVELAGFTFNGEAAKTKKQAEKNAAIAAWSSLKTMPNLTSNCVKTKELGEKIITKVEEEW